MAQVLKTGKILLSTADFSSGLLDVETFIQAYYKGLDLPKGVKAELNERVITLHYEDELIRDSEVVNSSLVFPVGVTSKVKIIDKGRNIKKDWTYITSSLYNTGLRYVLEQETVGINIESLLVNKKLYPTKITFNNKKIKLKTLNNDFITKILLALKNMEVRKVDEVVLYLLNSTNMLVILKDKGIDQGIFELNSTKIKPITKNSDVEINFSDFVAIKEAWVTGATSVKSVNIKRPEGFFNIKLHKIRYEINDDNLVLVKITF